MHASRSISRMRIAAARARIELTHPGDDAGRPCHRQAAHAARDDSGRRRSKASRSGWPARAVPASAAVRGRSVPRGELAAAPAVQGRRSRRHRATCPSRRGRLRSAKRCPCRHWRPGRDEAAAGARAGQRLRLRAAACPAPRLATSTSCSRSCCRPTARVPRLLPRMKQELPSTRGPNSPSRQGAGMNPGNDDDDDVQRAQFDGR